MHCGGIAEVKGKINYRLTELRNKESEISKFLILQSPIINNAQRKGLAKTKLHS